MFGNGQSFELLGNSIEEKYGLIKRKPKTHRSIYCFFSIVCFYCWAKPWPSRLTAIRFIHPKQDTGRRHRLVADTINYAVEVDYGKRTIQLGDSLMQFDSILDCPDGGDSEKVFVNGSRTRAWLNVYFDRRQAFPTGYRMLFNSGHGTLGYYDLLEVK